MTSINPAESIAKPTIVKMNPRVAEWLRGCCIIKGNKVGSPTTITVTSKPPINKFMPRIIIKKARISL